MLPLPVEQAKASYRKVSLKVISVLEDEAKAAIEITMSLVTRLQVIFPSGA